MSFVSLMFFCFINLPSLISSQQPYVSNNCLGPKSDNTSSVAGFVCNGVNNTCPAYLVYRTQPPYNNLSSIAALFSVNASEVSAINLSVNTTFPTNTEVLVPVTCSCAGRFYQANTTHVVQAGDTYYVLANNTFEGLTTCNAIRLHKDNPNVLNIFPNEKLTIPVRCACPTRKQVFGEGIRYLLSYVIQSGDTIPSIAIRFGATVEQTFEANVMSEQDFAVNPFTTVLVPFKVPPNSSLLEYSPLSLSPSSSLSALLPSPPSGGSNKKLVYLGVGIGAYLLVIGIIVLLIWLAGRKNAGQILPSESSEAQENALVKQSVPETEQLKLRESISTIASLKLKVYGFKDLQEATENFNPKYWVGDEVYEVYKGILNGNQVAIKKMHGDVRKEVNLLNRLNHINLVCLLGICFRFDDGFWYLVYKFTANGRLRCWIHQDRTNRKTLSWGNRIQVALDLAMGLNYLHSYTSLPHVHNDLNSSNVLLDGDFRAKITNFVLSRPLRLNSDRYTITKHIVGTKGYLAPEYLENGLISPMLDVYSFGLLLL